LSQHYVSENTIAKYFKLFSQIALKYYQDEHTSVMLEGEIELDESQLYKPKKSEAPGRPYVYDTIWLIGFRERHSQKFLIYPTVRHTEEVFIPLLLKHAKVKSLIYSDNFSTYVNNRVFPPESKLTQWGYRHKFVNHKIEFVQLIDGTRLSVPNWHKVTFFYIFVTKNHFWYFFVTNILVLGDFRHETIKK